MYYAILYYYLLYTICAKCTIDTRAVARVVTGIENRFIRYDNTVLDRSVDELKYDRS